MIKSFEQYRDEIGEVGHIESIVQSIVYVSGLPGVRLKELVVAEGGQRGIVHSISTQVVEVLMLDTQKLTNNLEVARTNQTFSLQVSKELLGRVVDPFAEPIDGAGPVLGEKTLQSIDPVIFGISKRVRIDKPMETGVTIVDMLVPLGYGQRELVIGDKKTGKSTFLLQTVASQVQKGVICVYVSIGKRQNDVKNIENYLRKNGVMGNCVLMSANSAEPATRIYLAPLSGFAIAEFFRSLGRDVLIILDDLTNHAKFYREISLLSKRAPGRGSYPGDIFHLHASLLERAGNINFGDGKAVSITALPVAETLEGDITGYIQTNLMAITDGHIFFDIEVFRKGQRPAINHALSVSRVGNQTRSLLDQGLAQNLRELLTTYEKDLEIARFGVELPENTQREIALGEKIELILNQDADTRLDRSFQLLLFGLLFSGFWDEKNTSSVKVDIIKLIDNYNKGGLKTILSQTSGVKNVEELKNAAKNYQSKVTEVLYV